MSGPNKPTSDQPPIGFVVVHGIGNQRPGELATRIAHHLADAGTSVEALGHGVGPFRDDQTGDLEQDPPIQTITVGDAPVHLREANWAPLSHPDNPPRLQLVPYLFLDFVDTVSRAWYASPQAAAIRRLSRGVTPVRSLVGWGMFTLLLTALLLMSVLVLDQSDPGSLVSSVAAGILGALLALIALYQAYRIPRINYLRARHAGQLKRVVIVVLWVPIAYLVGLMQLVFLVISAELLVFFFLVILVAMAFDYLVYLPTRAFAGTGWVLGKLRLKGVQRWIHRLGWVMMVMPVHSFLQAVKATGNLASVLLTERDLVPRIATVLWFFAVYVGFLGLVVLSEVLILSSGLGFFFLDDLTVGLRVLLFVFLFPIYLLAVKILLPVIDLILDISNYHLARGEDRGEYFERIEEPVRSLVNAGCREIHILAHSLGSVITYDWLSSPRSDRYAVTVLHTIGSPLNKFWYLDHARSARLIDRQGLSRLGGRWTNYWAWSDLVSGLLARYGTDAGGVSNTRLRWLGIALVSHGHYWKNPVVLAGVRRELAASRADA